MTATSARSLGSVVGAAIVILVAGLTDVAGADPKQAARVQYQRGVTAYNLGEFALAANQFHKAYRLAPTPVLLFNIAQAGRAARDYAAAERYYAEYLERVPEAPERDYIEERRAEMRLARDRSPASRRHAGRSQRIAGIASGATGAALLVTSVLFAREAGAAADDISAAFEDGRNWNDDYARRADEGRHDQDVAVVTAALGGALIVGGAISYYLGWRDARRARHVVVVATPHGAGIAASW